MHFFLGCVLLLRAVRSEDGQLVVEGGPSLEEVYGPNAEVQETKPLYFNHHALPAGYYDVRTKDNCIFPIELYIIQDETASFCDNYKQMKDKELKAMFDTISANHPESTFGVGTHRDIPIWSLGEPRSDYCWEFRMPLSANWTALYDTYDKLVSTGGGDPLEHQFGSIIAACQSNTPGWSNPLATRLVVVSTDAGPHFEDDGFNHYGLKPYSGVFEEANAQKQCTTQYYPNPEQVRAALKKLGAYAAFLVFDGEYKQGGKPIENWRWFNSYIGQGDEFVANVQKGATDFWQKLSDVITHLKDAECIHTSTSTITPPPTIPNTTAYTTAPHGVVVECPPCLEPDECECPCVRFLLPEGHGVSRFEVESRSRNLSREVESRSTSLSRDGGWWPWEWDEGDWAGFGFWAAATVFATPWALLLDSPMPAPTPTPDNGHTVECSLDVPMHVPAPTPTPCPYTIECPLCDGSDADECPCPIVYFAVPRESVSGTRMMLTPPRIGDVLDLGRARSIYVGAGYWYY